MFAHHEKCPSPEPRNRYQDEEVVMKQRKVYLRSTHVSMNICTRQFGGYIIIVDI